MGNLNQEKLQKIDNQIEAEQKPVSFDVREFTVEIYVQKYLDGLDKDDNELYIPDYQREFVWDNKHQSRFIESLILGLPVPFIFAAEIKESGRLEIVDGSQRIRTMAAFLKDELELSGLEKLTELNNTKYSQLPIARQRLIKNIAIRMVVLSSKATEDVRNEMFDRINTSSVPLLPMETRRGIYRGKFTNLIIELAKDKEYKKLCPISKYMENRREEEELLLRFFAFCDCYPSFKKVESMGVSAYLDDYLKEKNDTCTEEEMESKRKSFKQMVSYVAKAYPGQGFAKKKGVTGISKPYFEAISVGVHLALLEQDTLPVKAPTELILNKQEKTPFSVQVEGRYLTHTAKKIKERIDIVKQAFLNK